MNKDETIQKATNMVKKILYAINQSELINIKYLTSTNLFNKLNKYLEDNNNKNIQVHYERIHIQPSINREFSDKTDEYIEILFECNCIRYQTSLIDNSIVIGDKNEPSIFIIKGIVKKDKNVISTATYTCNGCGTSFDIIDNGICPNCGKMYDLKLSGYIMDDLNL